MLYLFICRSVSLLLCLLLSACAYEYTEPGRSGMSQVTPSGPTAIIESREYVYYSLPGIEISEQADGSFRYHYNRDDGGQLSVLRANVEEDYSGFGDPLKHEFHADP